MGFLLCRLGFVPAVVLSLLSLSCNSDPSTPFGSGLPAGKWRLDTLSAERNERHVVVIDIVGSSGGRTLDTLFVDSSGTWKVSRIVERRLLFSSLSDGYFRAVESTMADSTAIDSIPRYWYFVTRGDTARFYRGMRFVGGNVGLPGSWKLDRPDSLMMHGYLDLAISKDTIRVDNASNIPVTSGHYFYTINGSSLLIQGLTFGFGGDRYEVVPGASLYITSNLSARYVRVR